MHPVVRYPILAIFLFIALFPVYWIALMSLKAPLEWTVRPPSFIPEQFFTLNYVVQFFSVGEESGFSQIYPAIRPATPFLINSAIITVAAVGLALLVGTLTAYSLSRYRKGLLPASFLLLLNGIPPMALVIPLSILYTQTALYDTYLGLILINAALGTGLAIWIIKSFFDEVPREIEEVATLDGVTTLGAIFKFVIPLAKSALIVASVFAFIIIWGEFAYGLHVASMVAPATVQVVAYEHEIGHLFGPKSALGIILAIPAVIFGIVIRKHLSRALSLGAVGSLGSVQQEIGWVHRRYSETHRVANLLASPAHALVLFLLAFPLGLSLYLSFTSWTTTAGIPPWEAPFIGLQNYIDILNDTRFTDSLMRTGIVTVVPLAIELVVGLVLALLFLDKFRGRDALMIAFLLPLLIIPPVTAVNFHALFYPHGAFDSMLSLIAMREVSIPWFTNPNITLWLIILGEAWKWAPFMFLILLAGLLGLPQEPFRAARVLGASERQIFRHLTLPMLKPFIITALLIRAILSFRQFDLPRIMTAGGPGTATETVAIFFEMNFDLFVRFSYASAGVFIVISIMAVGTYLTVRRLLR